MRSPSTAKALAVDVLLPVEDLLRLPERLEALSNTIMLKSTMSQTDLTKRRVGFGTPPWGSTCSCCMPRCMGFLCCPCIVCCPGGGCDGALRYSPPKMLSICGCFWVQVHTKLQERLIQGLFFSIIYCGFYMASFFYLFTHFSEKCEGFAESQDQVEHIKACAFEIVGKCVSTIVLICYIPSLAICLYHIDRLDAVMETIETIWELEDIQRAVRGFNQHMQEVADQVLLLRAIEDRVMARTGLVLRFGRRVGVIAQKGVGE